MRDIKFRAWDKEKKYMVYDNDRDWMPESYPVWISHRGIVYCKRLEFKPGEGNFEFDAYKYENIEIMQYTGLKDKNGKEIYEGDICRQGKEIVVFEFERGQMYYGYAVSGGDFEIIGNIYENPELLKENL